MQKWNRISIREKLAHDDRWVCHALKILYDRQEGDEREAGQAKRKNGIGFNSNDAFFFSRLAEFFIKQGFLTKPQLAAARKAGIAKYWKQILEVIKANERIKNVRNEHERSISVSGERASPGTDATGN